MRIIYHQSFLGDTPNGIAAYLRTYLQYSSLSPLEYWSPAVADQTITLGRNQITLRCLPMSPQPRVPARLRIMAACAAARPQLNQDGQLVLTNVNYHATMVAGGRAPLVYISHGSNHPSMRKVMKLRDYLWVRFFDRLAVAHAHLVIVVSQQAHAEFTSRFPQYAGKIKYLPTFVDDEAFGPVDRQAIRRRLGIGTQTFVVTYAGRLVREKRVDAVIGAFAALQSRLADATLLIMGSGPEESQLRALTETLGLSTRVRFLGNCRPAQTIQTLAASDAALLLSAFEGISIFMLESLASGVPMVASNIADHRRILVDGQAGYVVSVDAPPDEVAQALLSLSADHRRLSENALHTAQRFMASAIVPQIDATLRELGEARR
jgi:glycosyltransferase involved in cell wall biosynthesis